MMEGRITAACPPGRNGAEATVVHPAQLLRPRRLTPHTLRSALRINLRVIGALILRDASSRFGHDNIGIFWLMGEPLILTLGVIGIWTMMGGTHGHDIGVVPFILSGYTLLTLWRHIIGRSVHVVRHGAGLLFHRNIYPLDIIIARSAMELVSILTAFFIAYIPLALFGVMEPIFDPLMLLCGWVACGLFSFGVGMMIAAVTEMSEVVERFVPAVLYLALPLTGSFFMVSWLPERAQDAMVWSPLVNAMEMFRAGLFSPDVQTRFYIGYTFGCCLAVNVIGLALLAIAQDHVRME